MSLDAEKKYQFKLCKFLIDQRKKEKRGRKNTTTLYLHNFPSCFTALPLKQSLEILKTELDQLVDEEILETNSPLIQIKNPEIFDDLDQLEKNYDDGEKIEIKIKYNRGEIEKFVDDLKGKKQNKNSKIKPLENLPDPGSFNWDDVEIKFINEDYTVVEVRIKRTLITRADHVRFGCSKTKDKIPTVNWNFLRLLSTMLEYKQDGVQQLPTIENLRQGFGGVTDNAIEQYKGKLSNILEQLFLKADPFDKYNKDDGYQPKFHLIPATNERNCNAEVFINRDKLDLTETKKTTKNNKLATTELLDWDIDK